MKTCTKCGKTKPLAAFHRRSDAPCGHRSQCKACEQAYRVRHRKRRKMAAIKSRLPQSLNLLWGSNKVTAFAAAAHVCQVCQRGKSAFLALMEDDGDLVLVRESVSTPSFMALHSHAVIGAYDPSSKVLDVMDDIKAHMREMRRAA